MAKKRIIIIGAAGRDFHNFNTVYRDNQDYEIVAFTATQIPEIDGRRYPAELAGGLYPKGIPIKPMQELEYLITEHQVDQCVFSYSDIHYVDLMQVGSRVLACGADFSLLSPAHTQVKASKPVISVLAVRTGCGKSQTTRKVVEILQKELGVQRVVCIRHPMPYGDIAKQAVQRFAEISDLAKHNCTIEEMEEYEPHIAAGNVIYSGVDYAAIVRQAEQEADVLVWDGGNNDPSFYRSDLTITVADPLRPGHELQYFAGETNVAMADVVIINKCGSAEEQDIETVITNVRSRNDQALILKANSPVTVADPLLVKGKRVLVVEDGPTVTHGQARTGAGTIAAQQYGAAEIIDPRPFAVGSLKEAYLEYPHLGKLLPALGYYGAQLEDLRQTIDRVDCDTVIIGTPIDLTRVVEISKPSTRVSYELELHSPGDFKDAIAKVLEPVNSAG